MPSRFLGSRCSSFLPRSYESVQAIELGKKAFPQQTIASATIVVKRADGRPLTAQDETRAGQFAQALQAKNIERTSGYQTGPQAVAPDRSVQVVNVGLDAKTPDDPALLDAVRDLRAAIGPELSESGLTAGVAGDTASFADNEDTFNEAFAIVTMAAMKDIGIPADKVNVNGGAVALGHPIGATGARIITTLIYALKKRGLKKGVAALCIGGGEGTAIALEVL